MRLRTQFLLLIIALFTVAGIAYEVLNNSYLEPEFQRQGLETVGLLAERERAKVEHTLELAEVQAQPVVSAQNITPQSTGLLFDAFTIYQGDTGNWKPLGTAHESKNPGAAAEVPAELSQLAEKKWSRLVADHERWVLWLRQDSNLISLSILDDEIKPFSEITKPAQGYLLSLGERTGSAEQSQESRLWRNWARGLNTTSEKVEILTTPKGNRVFAAYYPSAKYQFQVVIVWPEEFVQGQWLSLKNKTRALAGLALAIVGFFSIFLVRRALAPLEKLESATRSMGEGQFNVAFPEKSRDEVGHLMASFEIMSGKIQALMLESMSAARMEVELRAARMVQAMFLESRELDFGSIKVAGQSMSASECGGDLWSCWETTDHVYVVLADATGHGVPAALLTAALRSAISTCEAMKTDDFDLMMKLLRRAIADVGRGQITMTGYLLQINRKTGLVRSFNFSHHEALVFSAKKTATMRWKDVDMILDPINPSLGAKDQEMYAVGNKWLEPGDRLAIFTDGIYDIVDEQGERWKEREFLTTLVDAAKAGLQGELFDLFAQAWSQILTRKAHRELADDVTLVMIEWQLKDQPG